MPEFEYRNYFREKEKEKEMSEEVLIPTSKRYENRAPPAFFVMHTGYTERLLYSVEGKLPITRKLLEEPTKQSPWYVPDENHQAILRVPLHVAHAKGVQRPILEYPGFDNLIAIRCDDLGDSIYFFGWDDELAEQIVDELDRWRTPNELYGDYAVFKNEPQTWENVEKIERSIQDLNYCAFMYWFMEYAFSDKFGGICAHGYDTESG